MLDDAFYCNFIRNPIELGQSKNCTSLEGICAVFLLLSNANSSINDNSFRSEDDNSLRNVAHSFNHSFQCILPLLPLQKKNLRSYNFKKHIEKYAFLFHITLWTADSASRLFSRLLKKSDYSGTIHKSDIRMGSSILIIIRKSSRITKYSY